MTISRLNCTNSFSSRSRGRLFPRAGILGAEISFLKQKISHIRFIKMLISKDTLVLGCLGGKT